MKLEKYISAAKEAINKGYFGIQDALIKHDESLEALKKKGWNSKETAYQQEYQRIVDTFNSETAAAISTCKAEVQKQRDAYMREVSDYYEPDGGKIDLNDMNLIKAGLELSVDEFMKLIEKHAENPTMLRVIDKYVKDCQMTGKIQEKNHIYTVVLYRAVQAGKKEEKIFNSFVHLATMGMNHPDKSFTMYQAKLDDYEEDAVLDLLKAKLFIDEETQQRIDQIEQKQRDARNDKTKGKLWGTDTKPHTTYTKIS